MSDFELNIRLAFMVGIFLISAIFFLLLFFSLNRMKSLLWLSLYCFSHPIKSLFKPYQQLVSADFIEPYQHHGVSQLIVVLGGFFLIGFLLWELEISHKKRWISLYGFYCVVAYYFFSDRIFSDSLILLGLSLSIYGLYEKKKGALWLLVGMMGYATLNYLGYANILGFAYFTGIIFFIICMLISTGQNVSEEMRKQQAAKLRAATLENQLLRTTIQPHFVFNSLATMQELIEQSPEKASDFVEKIAREFQLITKASSKNLITLKEEIELCEMHLRIMEYRMDGTFKFHGEGYDGDELIPPGIFHTLVENGITHGYSNKKHGYFKLTKLKQKDGIEYHLFNDSNMDRQVEMTIGTGIGYVQSALEEHFGDRASLTWSYDESGWTVIITIKH